MPHDVLESQSQLTTDLSITNARPHASRCPLRLRLTTPAQNTDCKQPVTDQPTRASADSSQPHSGIALVLRSWGRFSPTTQLHREVVNNGLWRSFESTGNVLFAYTVTLFSDYCWMQLLFCGFCRPDSVDTFGPLRKSCQSVQSIDCLQ